MCRSLTLFDRTDSSKLAHYDALVLVCQYFLFPSPFEYCILLPSPPCSRSISTTTHTLYTIPASDHRFVRAGGKAPVLWRCRLIHTTTQKDCLEVPAGHRPSSLGRYRQLNVSISLEVAYIWEKRGGSSRTRRLVSCYSLLTCGECYKSEFGRCLDSHSYLLVHLPADRHRRHKGIDIYTKGYPTAKYIPPCECTCSTFGLRPFYGHFLALSETSSTEKKQPGALRDRSQVICSV